MKKLFFLISLLFLSNSIFTQTYKLPVDGNSLYYLLEEYLLLELDTLNKFYIKSDHSTRRIIIDKGTYEIWHNETTVLLSTMGIRGRFSIAGSYYLKNKMLYNTEKDRKKDRNGIAPTPKAKLKLPYKFNTLFAFSSYKRISIKKDELIALNKVSEIFKTKFLNLLKSTTPF
ncbi:MAG: hypothetical protein COA97_07190 [Flavobacteriales bacterium]|nr:MAG: hypothetical protein COA97_07190 [Flavobacteriales bacterium]